MRGDRKSHNASEALQVASDSAAAAAAASEAGDGWTVCDLPEYGYIRVSGSDAGTFLQGQCTVDVERVEPNRPRVGAFCDPKGRVLTLALFLADEAGFLLRMPAENVEPMLQKLARYVLRARVTLAEEDALRAVGFTANGSLEALAHSFDDLPVDSYTALAGANGWIVRVPGELPRFEAYGTSGQIVGLLGALSRVSRSDPELWKLLNIRAGVPEVYPACSAAFVPQMLDLQRLGGISFTKGCYTGQEIVARSQYLGTLKRGLVRARIDTGPCPQPGSRLYSDAVSGESEMVGQILCAAKDERGGFELLAVVRNAALDESAAPLLTEAGQQITVLASALSAAHEAET